MAWNLKEAVDYYGKQGAPGDQNALVSLLREIQQEMGGGIPQSMLSEIAEAYKVRESLLLALIKRIPSLRLSQAHLLELCAGPNCSKAKALSDYAEKLSRSSCHKFQIQYVPCMRMCGKGPNIKWDGKLYHGATETLLQNLIGGEQSIG